jgi:hypothetical protein
MVGATEPFVDVLVSADAREYSVWNAKTSEDNIKTPSRLFESSSEIAGAPCIRTQCNAGAD